MNIFEINYIVHNMIGWLKYEEKNIVLQAITFQMLKLQQLYDQANLWIIRYSIQIIKTK